MIRDGSRGKAKSVPKGTLLRLALEPSLLVVSGALLVLAFPNFNLSFLAYIGFVPLFFAIETKSPKKVFFIHSPRYKSGLSIPPKEPRALARVGSISCATGFIFYLGALYWLYHVTVIGLIIACLYLAVYFGIFGIAISRLGILSAPIVWVILEYIQANIPILGFGWLSLGYSQYKNLPLIQIADFSGVYGVSFMVMMVNVSVYMSLRGAHSLHSVQAPRRSNLKKSVFGPLAMASLVLIASCIYGFYRLNERYDTTSARVSVIQGNIPQELKWDPEAQDMIIEKYIALTKMAALESADLIVWPETSFPGFFEIDEDLTERVLTLAKEIKIPILIGANTTEQLPPRRWGLNPTYAVEEVGYFNSAVLISSKDEVINKYDKIHLVPFGEYVPFSNKFPALHKLVLGELGEFTPGKEFKTFSLQPSAFSQTVKFSVLICFEDIFPEISRKFVNSGAKFLIVITNDAWYGKSGAAYQHTANSVFRAIENRVSVVRCANTGVSSFIDSRGRIYDSVSEKNSHLFITGYKTAVVNIK